MSARATEQPTLYLTLKKQWFDEIAAGTKTEEYRDMSPHWQRFLGPYVGKPPWTQVHFRNGYHPESPTMIVELKGLRIGPHNGRRCYILSLGRILQRTLYRP